MFGLNVESNNAGVFGRGVCIISFDPHRGALRGAINSVLPQEEPEARGDLRLIKQLLEKCAR